MFLLTFFTIVLALIGETFVCGTGAVVLIVTAVGVEFTYCGETVLSLGIVEVFTAASMKLYFLRSPEGKG